MDMLSEIEQLETAYKVEDLEDSNDVSTSLPQFPRQKRFPVQPEPVLLVYDSPNGQQRPLNVRDAYDQAMKKFPLPRPSIISTSAMRKPSTFNAGRRVSFSSEVCYFEAVTVGDIDKVSGIIKEKDIDVNELTSYCRRNAIHICCSQGDLEMLKFLVSLGGRINTEDENGDTPLHRACEATRVGSHEDLIKYLVMNGAPLDRINNSNELPVDLTRYDFTIQAWLNAEMKKRNINGDSIRNAERNQLMVWAQEWRKTGKTNHEIIDQERGVTLAHYVAARRYGDVFKVLLKCPDIDMEATDWQGKTPMQIWTEKKHRSFDSCGTEACVIL